MTDRPLSPRRITPVLSSRPEVTLTVEQALGAVRRAPWLVVSVTLAALALGALQAFVLAVPVYRATAVVMLETAQPQIVDLPGIAQGLTGESAEINSEVEVLRARGLLGEVVDRLALTEDPEFNPALEPAGPVPRLLARWDRAAPAGPEAVRAEAVERLGRALSVRNLPQTHVFRVSAETRDPVKSARIADAVVARYVEGQLEVKLAALTQAEDWLRARVAELRSRLEEAEAERARSGTATDLVSAEALAGLERRLKSLRDRIDETEAARDVGSEALRARTVQQLDALRASEAELKDRIDRQSEDLIALRQLDRESEAIRTLYEYFLARLNETSAQRGMQQPDSRILSTAAVPRGPSAPDRPKILALAGLLGLALGVVLAVRRDLRRDGFPSGAALEDHAGLPVLGEIPQVRVRGRRALLRYLVDHPTSAAGEAVRSLRTSLALADPEGAAQVLVATSAVPGEGKTTMTLALAHQLAGLGKRVVVVEGDLRLRTFGSYFDGLPEAGLAQYLRDEAGIDGVIQGAPGFGADLLSAGGTLPAPGDAFHSERFRALLRELRARYDLVLIDTPPVLAVPDARLMARQADAVLVSVRWERTQAAQLDHALRLLRGSEVRVAGLVLSRMNPRGARRYGAEAYGSQAARYYSA
ncbi:polysaccharide biosynthesis tyrosine autokinase [Histidinibacterium aquaticum]|nr:polysaccharide biosynthesis tyrosine autokinase [Histidinibacterium aquaticum]